MKRSILLSASIALAVCASFSPHARAEPADAAIAYLEKIASQSLDLGVDADTAISRHTGTAKQREIAGRIDRMALDVAGGGMEAGEVRIDGNLAGVIVHKISGYNPEKVAAFAVALIQSDGRWIPAPVPASFENTGVSLDLKTRHRATSLERWMLRQQARALDELRDGRLALIRRDVAAAINRTELETMDTAEMAAAFLTACRNGDQLRLLGMLGGLSEPLPSDWAQRLRMVEQAMEDLASAPPGWRAVAAPEVVRALVHEESGLRDGLFSVAFIDPTAEVPRGGVPPVQLIHIDMERDHRGAWVLNLPESFSEDTSGWRNLTEEENPFDSTLFNAFPTRLRQAHPAVPQGKPEALWKLMHKAIRSDTPNDLLRMLALPEDDPTLARRAIGRVARLWWQIRSADGGRALIPLAFHHHDGQALAMAQLFTFREPDRTDLRMFHMIRTDRGWMWQSTGKGEPTTPLHDTLNTWRDEQRDIWINGWTKAMLAPVEKLDAVAPDTTVGEAEAKTLVTGLLDAIAAGDLDGCLQRIGVLDDAEGHKRLLRNLGYELSTRLSGIKSGMRAHTGKHWTAVTCQRQGDVNPGMAFFPIVATQAGPRVLLELDLFVGTRRRDFLNNAALERLDGYTDAEVRADLRRILQSVNRE